MIEQIDLEHEEKTWLEQHGGRDGYDVFLDEKGRKFVIMTTGWGGEKKVYLPQKRG